MSTKDQGNSWYNILLWNDEKNSRDGRTNVLNSTELDPYIWLKQVWAQSPVTKLVKMASITLKWYNLNKIYKDIKILNSLLNKITCILQSIHTEVLKKTQVK